MTIYYKYYSHLPLEFFDKPSILLTPVAKLNDPFEALLPTDIYDDIIQSVTNNSSGFIKKELTDLVQIKKILVNLMITFGIVSFSETQRNLLMWAHYANQHQGLCIGYDIETLFTKEKASQLKRDAVLHKVRYDSIRHEMFGQKNEFKEAIDAINYIIYNVMLTKGDGWIYEKEHRLIINLDHADEIIFSKISNSQIKTLIKQLVNENAITQHKDSELKYTNNIKDTTHGIGFFSHYKVASLFVNIDPKSIKSIYFGCRTDDGYIDKVKSVISNEHHALHGVHIQKFALREGANKSYGTRAFTGNPLILND